MDNVFYLANKLQYTVESQWSSIDGEEGEALEALHLRRTAQKVLSRASILSGLKSSSYEESVRSASVTSRRGHLYDMSEATHIEMWVEQQIKPEDEHVSSTLPVHQMGSDVSTEMDRGSSHRIVAHSEYNEEDEFNPEEDFDLDLMLALSKAGKKHYENHNPEQAAENLDLALKYAQKLSPGRYLKQDLTRERLILATIYLQKRELDKADEHLSTLIRESIATQENREMINDAHLKLARVYYLKKSYEEALRHCQKCVHARTTTYGKNSKQYYEGIQLLVLIYSGKGSHLEADVMLNKLPEDVREETELQLQTSAPVGTLPTSPPLSPKPRPHTSSRHRPARTLFEFRKRSSMDKGSTLSPPAGLSLDTDSGSSNNMHFSRQGYPFPQDLDPVEVLAKAGFAGDFDSAKALSWAIVDGHLKVVHYLLEGYSVPKSRKPRFSLHPSNHASSVSDVVVKCARVDGTGKSKTLSPLMTAIEHSRVMIAKLLLDRGASTSIKNDVGRSPLRFASERGHAEIVKLLLAKGAWIESPSHSSRADSTATGRDHNNNGDTTTTTNKERDFRAYTPLHGAAANGHEDIVHALLAAGSAVDARDTHGSTALKHACQRGQTGVVRLLLHEGASIGAADNAGFTPLMAAAFNGHEGMVRLLRSAATDTFGNGNGNGPVSANTDAITRIPTNNTNTTTTHDAHALDINAKNAQNQTALLLAAEQGHTGTCKLLLDAGARLEAHDSAGWTALIGGANKGHLGVVLLLLGAGADINAQSDLGSTALDRAEYRNDRALARVLRENGAVNGTRRVEGGGMTAWTG
ncbi:MAG: hypothetical protein LQ340_007208, partial [Diploschistes diacapsis]